MNRRGFTLIEVLVASMILVGAILLVGTSWSGSFSRLRKTQLNHNVAELLDRKATEISVLYRDSTLLEISDQAGDFGSDFPQYRWTFTVQPFEMPDVTAALTSQGTGAKEEMLLILNQMRETMSKSILEGTVTVYVKNKNKEVPFSVTTYFVDYAGAKIGGLGGGSQ